MQLGMIGLGRMGANMVQRLRHGGHDCVVFDVNSSSVGKLVSEGATGAASLDDFVAKLKPPRAAWLMVPAAAVDKTLQDLAVHLQPGDTIIDGGNSYYHDDIRRASELKPKGIHYVDVGTSGGVWGSERGYCLMIGGERSCRPAPRSRLRRPGSWYRNGGPHARSGEDWRHRRARLPALRAERRGPLRQDGPQRHRVRHHGRLRGGAEHPPPCQRRQAAARPSMPKPRRCATPSTTSTT